MYNIEIKNLRVFTLSNRFYFVCFIIHKFIWAVCRYAYRSQIKHQESYINQNVLQQTYLGVKPIQTCKFALTLQTLCIEKNLIDSVTKAIH